MPQAEYGVGNGRSVVGVVEMTLDGSGNPVPLSSGLGNFVAMTPGTLYAAGAFIQVVCTVAGNVVLLLSGGVQNTIPVSVGLTILPFAVTKVVVSGTTATATYGNLS